jgi:hypothetical protein
MFKFRAFVNLSYELEVEGPTKELASQNLKNYFAQNNNLRLRDSEITLESIEIKKESEILSKEEPEKKTEIESKEVV